MNRSVKLILLFALIGKVAYAQISVQLRDKNKAPLSPELYFKFKLQDTIFSKHEGLKIKNFASVKFDVDKNGFINNIFFSVSTDSLLKPYIKDALNSTNQRWIIKHDNKRIKGSVTIILPILFTLRPRIEKRGSSRVDEFLGEPVENIEVEATDLFQFEKKPYILFYSYRNPVKYSGVVLNPIDVRVPYDPDANDY
ncbi:MAG TPA: hypothetical protein VIM75_00945 [Ohtaekwangia sp.]|uniref:hypothetical protein n=1 Tax=Ohtaekwangia sp. TaxID=2066019 RepID=UPI002F9228D5